MKFIDEVTIEVQAGHGGAGARSFRREKFVPFGGPDGGNGGAGGSVFVVGDRNKRTLLDFQSQPQWMAGRGGNGEGRRKDGKTGADLTIRVPLGTEVIDLNTGAVLADITTDLQQELVAKGGRGGKGNDFFKSATNQTPQHAQPGEPGEERKIQLSLKLLADVGIVGFPNAGKSTLISAISEARPRIADYPFTTLTPTLGVVRAFGDRTFVVADIPGLIEGASDGKGLGIAFLKHIERTALLVHLVDVAGPLLEGNEDPEAVIANYNAVRRELCAFSDDIAERQEIVVLSKIDLIPKEALAQLCELFKSRGTSPLCISTATGDGVKELVAEMGRLVFGTERRRDGAENPSDNDVLNEISIATLE